MSTNLRAAVVGLGIGRTHAEQYARRSDVDVVGLVDPAPAALEAAAKVCDAPHFTDLDTMLGRARPDVVSLATPPHLHLDQTAACVAAGAHVLVEKPLAVTADHCRRFVELAAGTDRVVMVAQKKRFTAPVRVLKEKLDGPWGVPRVVSASRIQEGQLSTTTLPERRAQVLGYLRRVRRYRRLLLNTSKQHVFRDGEGAPLRRVPPLKGRLQESDFQMRAIDRDEMIDGTHYVEELIERARRLGHAPDVLEFVPMDPPA